MKKITISKEEGVAEVIERVLGAGDPDITLVIPKDSALARSVANFHLLKREADSADTTIAIESVDDGILAFAKEADLEANHPLWRGVAGAGGVSDIVPAGAAGAALGRDVLAGDEEDKKMQPASKRRAKKKGEAVKLTVQREKEDDGLPEEAEEEIKEVEEKEDRFLERSDEREDASYGSGTGSRRISRKYVWIGAGALAAFLVALGVVTWSFGRASVTIEFKKTPWQLADVFAADKSVSKVNAATNVIPAQVFTANKNATQLFPASGRASVSIKAHGTITVVNAYSSAPQDLVATTRFVTPDGKIFRLVGGITVPGARVTDGTIVPSSIDAAVVADQAGPAYNLGPVDKLTIPGFQRSPKYNAFYGRIKGVTTGGFTGSRAVPTAADIASAKDKTIQALKRTLTNGFTTNYPNNFKILDGATSVAVTKLTVGTTTDDNGNFSVFGEATLQAIGFDEAAFKAYLLSLAQGLEQNSVFSDLALSYSDVKADFARGRVNFSLTALGTLEPAFSPDDFRGAIAGKSVNAARAAIAALAELTSGKLSVWPMWLSSIPSNQGRIHVTAN